MSNETKRDVFEAVWNRLAGYQVFFNGWPREAIDEYKKRYNAALPDDLPVIPKAVSEYFKKAKAPGKWGLLDVFWHLGDNISAMGINGLYDWQRWMVDNQVAVARAWLLGVWRVEETGEIVKLEEEK
ncbi:hypothetical protein ACR74M_05840 [Lacticaseibacillus paracasei]|uniref:hypothetical protein n=1 Tax=Lacticaseibacillus paracasei TaxID=1597 RepID=UPI003DA2CCDE